MHAYKICCAIKAFICKYSLTQILCTSLAGVPLLLTFMSCCNWGIRTSTITVTEGTKAYSDQTMHMATYKGASTLVSFLIPAAVSPA